MVVDSRTCHTRAQSRQSQRSCQQRHDTPGLLDPDAPDPSPLTQRTLAGTPVNSLRISSMPISSSSVLLRSLEMVATSLRDTRGQFQGIRGLFGDAAVD